jgi:hypothetical protein
MEHGIIPSSPASFTQLVAAPLAGLTLPTPPLWRRPPPVVVPHRSAHLAKKVARRSPAVVVAQNLLMKKLGLLLEGWVDSESFDCYVQMFIDGLTEHQVELIVGDFMPHAPVPDEVVVVAA